MTLVTDIAAYLVDQSVCTALGTDLFIMDLPDTTDLITAVFQYAGQPPGNTFDSAYDDHPGLQIRTRAAVDDLESGETRANAAYAALHGVANTSLSGTTYKLIEALGSPGFIGYDEKGRPEWTQNFRVIKEV